MLLHIQWLVGTLRGLQCAVFSYRLFSVNRLCGVEYCLLAVCLFFCARMNFSMLSTSTVSVRFVRVVCLQRQSRQFLRCLLYFSPHHHQRHSSDVSRISVKYLFNDVCFLFVCVCASNVFSVSVSQPVSERACCQSSGERFFYF
jgi:hypothetical protein